MSEEEDKFDLENIVDKQFEKMTVLQETTLLLQCKREIKDDLQELQNVVFHVTNGIENMRKTLATMKEQNTRLKELSSLLETLDRQILQRTENVPSALIQAYQAASKKKENVYNELTPDYCSISSVQTSTAVLKTPGSVNNRLKNIEIHNCKRVLSYEPDQVCSTIPFITAEEFSKIPKYMIGRQTLETVNSLISGINQTLIAKYTIVSLGKTGAQKKGEINLYLHYKKQERDLKGENGYFFTAEDYYRQTKTKLDKTKLNLITALRHCKRLRECRMQNDSQKITVVAYVITPH